MWHLGQHILLGIVVGLSGVLLLVMLRLGQHTLLLCYARFRATHLLGIIRYDVGRLHQWVQNNI
jgi:hypothetical protein